MDYLADRTGKLSREADGLGLDDKQKAFVNELLRLIADMAVIIDDAVDAVDEIDMRLIELEQQHEEEHERPV